MNTVKIAIFDRKNHDMGLEQEDKYTDLFFRDKDLTSFWVSADDDGKMDEIVFQCGGHQFVTPYSRKTEDRFKDILSKNG